jgi:hypothetical protein
MSTDSAAVVVAKPKKGKKAAAAAAATPEGDIGELKREFQRKKQSHERKRRRATKKAEAAEEPAAAANASGGDGHSAAPSAAYLARCKQMEHMDLLAELVQSRLATFAPDAVMTKEAAYDLAEIARITILQIIDRSVELSDVGAGTRATPLGHEEALVGARTVVPENLIKAFIYRCNSELAAQQGTLDAAQKAFAAYTDVVA